MNASRFLLIALATTVLPLSASAATMISFDELSLSPNSYFDGHGAGASPGTWTSQGATFNTGTYGPGWSYSNVTDNTTAGHLNQWSAITGTDASGSGNYVIGTTFSPNGAYFNLPGSERISSIAVTNTTYAYLSMLNGDEFAKDFGGTTGDDEDFFQVTFTGFDSSNGLGGTLGSVDFFLADYRFADNANDYIVDSWQTVDLTSLGNARSIGISFASSDVGSFGMNTPAYVAIDNISFQAAAVPEPTSLLCIGALVLATSARRIRNRFASLAS